MFIQFRVVGWRSIIGVTFNEMSQPVFSKVVVVFLLFLCSWFGCWCGKHIGTPQRMKGIFMNWQGVAVVPIFSGTLFGSHVLLASDHVFLFIGNGGGEQRRRRTTEAVPTDEYSVQ